MERAAHAMEGRTRRRVTVRMVTTVLAGMGALALPATAMSAAAVPAALHTVPGIQQCSGILIRHQQVVVHGRAVGELDVWSSPRNGGTVMACTRHLGPALGAPLPTRAQVTAAASPTAGRRVVAVSSGRPAQHTGAAAIGGVRGNCFQARGWITVGGHVLAMATPWTCTRAR